MKTIYTYSTTILIILFSLNVNANTPPGIVYQLTINNNDLSSSKKIIDDYPNLRKVDTDGVLQYQFGNYTTYDAVKTIKSSLLNAGCSNVNILAYNNHILIPLSEAITIEYKNDYLNSQKVAKKVAKTITTKEVNYLLDVKNSGLQHYYSLAIPIASVETVDLILEEIDNEQVIEISIDDKLYSIGKYETFEEVIAARKQFIESEIFDVFIMAQITDNRINEGDTQNLAKTIQSVVNELAAK
tara:strand:- start:8886 stop:9611 length:726 start_codon:yes stop_codon:yes gene_type:complete